MSDKSIWKVVEHIDYQTGNDCVKQLLKRGYRVSEWIQDIVSRRSQNIDPIETPIKLSRICVSSLGLDQPTTLAEIYQRLSDEGFELVPPEVAIYCRFLYDEQPTGEWLRFATPMNSMIDSDGVPHLLKLGKALGLYFIETYWSYEGAIFHPHNDFIVMLKE